MKPMVVSAANAGRTSAAAPKESAAPPCNKCRREILPKSIWMLPLWSDRPSAGCAGLATPEPDVASFVPEARKRASIIKILKSNGYDCSLNLGQKNCEYKI